MSNNGDQIAVRYGSLEEAASSIDRQAERLRADLEDIRSAVARVSANWEGEAQSTYNQMQAKWNDQADSIHNTLKTIASKVRQSSGDYSATDRKASGQFGG